MSSVIVYTGNTGALGSQMPQGGVALQSRLENSHEEMATELKGISASIQRLVHMAALTSVRECDQDPQRAAELNIAGAVKWLKAAESADLKQFVFVSTNHVYAAVQSGDYISESHPVGPRNSYGKTSARILTLRS